MQHWIKTYALLIPLKITGMAQVEYKRSKKHKTLPQCVTRLGSVAKNRKTLHFYPAYFEHVPDFSIIKYLGTNVLNWLMGYIPNQETAYLRNNANSRLKTLYRISFLINAAPHLDQNHNANHSVGHLNFQFEKYP